MMIMIITVCLIMLTGFGAYMTYTIEKQKAMECHREITRELNRLERKLKDDSMRYIEREETKGKYWDAKVKAERYN